MKKLIIILCILIPVISYSQATSLEEVIKLALEHNYGIKLAEKNTQIAEKRATKGNAGYMPSVSLSGSYKYSLQESETEFAGGSFPKQSVSNASTQNYGASLDVNYIIFDGQKPKYTLLKNKMEIELGKTLESMEAENTIFQISQAYYQLATLQENLKIAKTRLELNNKQIRRLEKKKKYGQGNESERLNLLTNYNQDTTQVLRLQMEIQKGIRMMNKLIGIKILEKDLEIAPKKELNAEISLEILMESMKSKNAAIKQSTININKTELDIKLVKTDLYPKLQAGISYGYTGTNSDAGIMSSSQGFGPSASVGLNYNLYNGGRVKTAIKVAELGIENQKMMLERSLYELDQDLNDAYITYQNNLDLIAIEKSNVEIAKQSYQRIEKIYELGQAAYLDFRTAQLNYISAQMKVNNAVFSAKLSELVLLKIAGMLI